MYFTVDLPYCTLSSVLCDDPAVLLLRMSLWVLGCLHDGRSVLVHALLSIVLGPGQAVVRLTSLRIDG